ncbi:hypothetical protein B296_00021180 [Ensete ventricosum]|uniref:Uncharacterized protein n=1 Tax=Ensete ventricosum TaxID=4639 RepID=A0A427A588_ENSVE|nr:hypothetical protein B296_00021180 [Ensete ventricosum]
MELGYRRPPRKLLSSVVEARVQTEEKMVAATEKTTYKDNWFDRLAIRYLSRSIQATTVGLPVTTNISTPAALISGILLKRILDALCRKHIEKTYELQREIGLDPFLPALPPAARIGQPHFTAIPDGGVSRRLRRVDLRRFPLAASRGLQLDMGTLTCSATDGGGGFCVPIFRFGLIVEQKKAGVATMLEEGTTKMKAWEATVSGSVLCGCFCVLRL